MTAYCIGICIIINCFLALLNPWPPLEKPHGISHCFYVLVHTIFLTGNIYANIFKDDNETNSSNGGLFQTYVNGAITQRPTHA